MKWTPRGFGGERPYAEDIKRDGWRNFKILVIHSEDDRLSWSERAVIRDIGARLYGSSPKRPA